MHFSAVIDAISVTYLVRCCAIHERQRRRNSSGKDVTLHGQHVRPSTRGSRCVPGISGRISPLCFLHHVPVWVQTKKVSGLEKHPELGLLHAHQGIHHHPRGRRHLCWGPCGAAQTSQSKAQDYQAKAQNGIHTNPEAFGPRPTANLPLIANLTFPVEAIRPRPTQ